MTDFLGRKLILGDECVYLRRKRTPRGAPFIELEKGIVIGLSEDKVTMRDEEGLLSDYDVDYCNVVRVEFTDDFHRVGMFE